MQMKVKHKTIIVLAILLVNIAFIAYQISVSFGSSQYTFFGNIFDSSTTTEPVRELHSTCECRRKQKVNVKRTGGKVTVSVVKSHLLTSSSVIQYSMPIRDFDSATFMCDPYKVLRRGPHTKVLSYSLYGRDQKFYKQVKKLIKQVHALFPGWLMRINYDSSIDDSTRCELECLEDENGVPYDIVDFCDVEHLPLAWQYHNSKSRVWNATYMHAMMWRWLAMGDTFVDVFASRDLDSLLFQREVDAVNAWLATNKSFHIMRDHPQHSVRILGGMWGMTRHRDMPMSSLLLSIFTNVTHSSKFNPRPYNKKGLDQDFLGEYFYPLVANNSLVHDSFRCQQYKDSEPWPTKRIDRCYVGFKCEDDACDCRFKRSDRQSLEQTCPIDCRPRSHQDWEYC